MFNGRAIVSIARLLLVEAPAKLEGTRAKLSNVVPFANPYRCLDLRAEAVSTRISSKDRPLGSGQCRWERDAFF